jgi:integrase
MKGYSVYARAGRPAWYVSYLSADDQEWHHEATAFRRDDPLGKKKAARYGEAKAAEFFASVKGDHRAAWGAWVPQFLRLRHRNSQNTLERYLDAWDSIRLFLSEHRLVAPAQVEYRHAAQLIAWRCAQSKNSGAAIKRNTAVYELKVWAMLMHEAVRRGFCLGNPIANSGEKKDPPRETPELTPADIAAWRAALAKEESHLPLAEQWKTTAFEIALHQACRERETSLPLSQIDFDRWTIRTKIKGANGKERWHIQPVHPAIRPRLEALRAAEAKRTCDMPKMASKLLWQFRQRNNLGHTVFHSTRVTVITQFARQGVPEQQAMAYVGHSSRAVHRIYQRLRPEDLSACTAALNFAVHTAGQSTPDASSRIPESKTEKNPGP